MEFNQHLVLTPQGFLEESKRISAAIQKAIAEGTSVVVYTRRERIDLPTEDPDAQFKMSTDISSALAELVRNLQMKPSFLIAKGGITSYDIGVNVLAVQRVKAMGQIALGVPVWRTGDESKFPGLPYIIFQGFLLTFVDCFDSSKISCVSNPRPAGAGPEKAAFCVSVRKDH